MTNKKRINIYLPEVDIEKLRFKAFNEKISISEIIRNLVDKFLKKKLK